MPKITLNRLKKIIKEEIDLIKEDAQTDQYVAQAHDALVRQGIQAALHVVVDGATDGNETMIQSLEHRPSFKRAASEFVSAIKQGGDEKIDRRTFQQIVDKLTLAINKAAIGASGSKEKGLSTKGTALESSATKPVAQESKTISVGQLKKIIKEEITRFSKR